MRELDSKKSLILDRVDLLDLVSEHVTLKQRGRRWVGLCPFHTEKTPSFTVTPELGVFKCFGCGKGGDVFSFVQLRENVGFMEAMGILGDRVGVEIRGGADPSQGPTRAELARVNAWALAVFRANLRNPTTGSSARGYLANRGFGEAIIDRFDLGLAAGTSSAIVALASRKGIPTSLLLAADLVRQSDDGGRIYETFRNRLMFPIRDATKRVVGFGGRTLGDDRAKYLNTSQNALFDKGRGLYGIDQARDAIARRGRAILVEGYTDCIAAHQAGFPETLATLGTALADAQVALLRRLCDKVILLFDSDEAGETAADRAIRVALPHSMTVMMARIPDGKDPCELLSRVGADGYSDVLNGAVDALEFKWSQMLRRMGPTASSASKHDAILDFLGVVVEAVGSGSVDEIQRGLLVNQVAHVLRVSNEEVHRLISRLRRKHRVGGHGSAETAPRRTQPKDEEQAVWVHVLEVLLNEPGLLRTVGDMPDARGIRDDRDRRIACAVIELAGAGVEFDLSDVVTRGGDPSDASRVAELAGRGAGRGNYENTLRVALERIRRTVRDQEVDRSKQQPSGGQSDGQDGDARQHLAAIHHHRLKHGRPFLPRRLVRQIVPSIDAASTPGTTEVATVEQP